MTLTAAQINDIAVAIGMTPTLLNAHLVSSGNYNSIPVCL